VFDSKVWQFFMAPFSLLYKWVMQFRNYLYDIEHKPAFEFDNLVISVGNLSVGGTGKTPFIEYLIRYFNKRHAGISLSTLSRGYGRKSKGFLLANNQSTASQIGDEPYQIYMKFGEHIKVAVCEDRVLAVPSILLEHPDNQVVLLDDAFQHRSIKPNFSVMLTDYHRPFYNDYVLPAGLLREGRVGAKRADVIIITKCPPELDQKHREVMQAKVNNYAPEAKVYFSGIKYGPIAPIEEQKIKNNIILLTGIANTFTLEEHLEKGFTIKDHIKFPDHHQFTVKELEEVAHKAQSYNADIITTEKDWVRIIGDPALFQTVEGRLFYQPMMVQFLGNESEFLSLLDTFVMESSAQEGLRQ